MISKKSRELVHSYLEVQEHARKKAGTSRQCPRQTD
jgi:hypothetical protein